MTRAIQWSPSSRVEFHRFTSGHTHTRAAAATAARSVNTWRPTSQVSAAAASASTDADRFTTNGEEPNTCMRATKYGSTPP